MPLFDHVLYHVSQSLPEETRTEISRILDHNGAVAVELQGATHIISNTIEFEGCDNLLQNAFCVTPYWVERSMEMGMLQDAKFFSADKTLFFSGVIAACADLPEGDREVIASGIQELGGTWREGLTRDVTHLIVTNPNSEKYQVAMHFRDSADIKVVLPHWFDQCWAMQMLIPTTLFQFPDPPYLKKDYDANWYKAQLSNKKDEDYLPDGLDKKAIFHTLARDPSFRQRSPRDIWQGRKILLSASLGLHDERKEALEERIRLAGGSVLSSSSDTEGTVVDDADVLITRYRAGAAYTRALDKGKTVGSLAWFLYVDKIGLMSRPRDQLLHYPIRSKPIPGFKHHEITVTNYQGDARNYLKKLIQLMGATFTPTMSGKNTVVIAAYKSGSKTTKAEEWSVPVVNHKWLEDCFIEWRNLTPAVKKYIDFTQGFNYGTLLGERGVGHVGLQTDPDLPAETDKEASTSAAPAPVSTPKPSPKKARPKPKPKQPASAPASAVSENFLGAANSFRDALEVEEVEDVLSVLDHPVPVSAHASVDRLPPSPPAMLSAKDKSSNKPKPKSAALLAKEDDASGPSKHSNKLASKARNKKTPAPEEEKEEEEEEEEEEEKEAKETGAEEEEHEDEEPVKKKQRISTEKTTRTDSKVKPKSKAKPASMSKDGSEGSIEEIPLPSKKIGLSNNGQGSSRDSPKVAKSSNKKAVDDELQKIETSRTSASPAKPNSKLRFPLKSTHAKGPPPSFNDSSDHEPVEGKRPKVVYTYKSNSSSPAKAKTQVKRTRAESSSDDEGCSDVVEVGKVMSGHKAAAQKAIRPASTRTVAVELSDQRPFVLKKSPSRSSTAQNDHDQAIQSLSETSSIFLLGRPPPRRSAAAAATEKLRTKIMPDVMNFENERKKSAATTRRRKSSLGTSLSVDDDEASEASGRVSKKPRFSMDAEDSDEVPKGLITHAKSFKKPSNDKSEKKTRTAVKPDGEAIKPSDGTSSMDPKKIRILTTKIEVPEGVEEVLMKLGVKFTAKPTECTHLVASGMARTEKFLCALPQAPFVLNGDWLAACAKEKKILAEEQFALHDPDVEHKHKFKLSEALERAQELKKKKTKLLQGHMFYVTPNVKVDYEMLSNILVANGAQSKQATPNVRNLSDTKHVISCLKDEHLWRVLDRSGIPIYSQELVLSGAFKQSMDWDSPEMRVQEST